jgi:ribosomal protein S18 acetylase RimI-like enzyme
MSADRQIVIRSIEDRDIPGVVALWHAAGVARPWNDPHRDIAFARREPHATVLVAHDGDNIVATAMIGEDGHRGWVYYMAVHPDHQKSGLGRRILAAAEDWLGARGCWKVQLLVREDNAAVKDFYRHLGYQDTRAVCLQKIIEAEQ